MLSSSRRQFLAQSSVVAASALLPTAAWGASARQRRAWEGEYRERMDATPKADDPTIAACVASAVEAARSAGATYADARYQTFDQEHWGRGDPGVNVGAPFMLRDAGLGVRVLYNGYWGYVGLSLDTITVDEAARLGRAAVAQAKTGARGRARSVELAPAPVVSNGTWTTPIEIDPFTVSWDEKTDQMNSWPQFISALPFEISTYPRLVQCNRQTQTFASSDGSSYAQTLYRTGVRLLIITEKHWRTDKAGTRTAEHLVSLAGAGWEYVRNAPFEENASKMIARAMDARLAEPIEVGRYDVVFDGVALAKLADAQLGNATELDRAMGYLANRDGTSYLNDPLAMLGTHKVGSSLLNVTANRSMPGGAATVKWDDEGVEPDEAVLVKDGILTDFQTTRESASWLAPYYQKIGKPVRSHGGVTRCRVTDEPQQAAHNLVIAPSKQDTSFEALCSGIKKGLAVFGGESRADQQVLNSESSGEIVYEIVNGKLGRTLGGGIMLTRTPEFWKNLIGVGGASTVCALGLETSRQDMWGMYHTVSAPAAAVKQVAVTVNTIRTV